MGLLGDLIVRIKGDTGQLVSGLKSADKQVTKFARFVMSGAGIGGAILVFRQLGKMVGDVVKIVGEQEEAEGKLRSAIKATGKEASISVASIAGLANQLQRTTVYGDEATLSAAAMLQQLGNLDEKGLKVLIPRVQNFAAAMGLDLQQAASLVGKTLGSTTNALGRYGIQIDMSKDKSGKFSQLVEQLDGKFAGMAETIGQTTSGKLKILQNQFSDLKQELALNLLPTMNQLLGGLAKILSTTASRLSVNKIISPKGFQATISSFESAQSAVALLEIEIETLAKSMAEFAEIEGYTLDVDENRLKKMQNTLTMIRQVLPLLETQKKAEMEAAKATQASRIATEEQAEAVEQLDVELQQFIADQTQVVAGFQPVTMGFLGLTDAYNQFIDELAAREPEYKEASKNRLLLLQEEKEEKLNMGDWELQRRRQIEDALAAMEKERQDKGVEGEEEAAAKKLQIASRTFSMMGQLIGTLGSIFSAYYSNQLADETLTDKERKKIQRQQAKSSKAVGIFEAIINTASAIAEALPNVPLAIFAGVLGAVQVGLIASQPLPKLARGGKLMRPTLFMGGEAGPEWVVPDLKMDELGGRIAEAMRNATINNTIMNDQPIMLSVSLDGRQLDAHVERQIADRKILLRNQ